MEKRNTGREVGDHFSHNNSGHEILNRRKNPQNHSIGKPQSATQGNLFRWDSHLSHLARITGFKWNPDCPSWPTAGGDKRSKGRGQWPASHTGNRLLRVGSCCHGEQRAVGGVRACLSSPQKWKENPRGNQHHRKVLVYVFVHTDKCQWGGECAYVCMRACRSMWVCTHERAAQEDIGTGEVAANSSESSFLLSWDRRRVQNTTMPRCWGTLWASSRAGSGM